MGVAGERTDWSRLPRPMTPVTEARTEDLPRHPVVWIALGLVVASAVAPVVSSGRAIGSLPLMTVVLAPAALAFLVGWIPWHGSAGRWALLVGSAAFAAVNFWTAHLVLTDPSSTAALGFVVTIPALLLIVALTWGVTAALNRLAPPTAYR